MKSRNPGAGLLLIILGAVLLAANLGAFSLLRFWPLLIVGGGVCFFLMWLWERGNYGLLMPAAILTIVGVLFLYCEIDGWWHMEDLWPVFILAPGVGFILMYTLGAQDRGLLMPGSALLVIGIFLLSANRWAGPWWPLVLVLAGVLILLRRPQAQEFEDATPDGGLFAEPEDFEPLPGAAGEEPGEGGENADAERK